MSARTRTVRAGFFRKIRKSSKAARTEFWKAWNNDWEYSSERGIERAAFAHLRQQPGSQAVIRERRASSLPGGRAR